MLMLLFYVGSDSYALDCKYIIEVVPRATLKKISHLPDHVAGLLNFRGMPVPVIDICQLILKRPSTPRLHTRIIILNRTNSIGENIYMGMIAEKVTESIDQEKSDFIESAWEVKSLPFLGGIFNRGPESIQFFHVDKLFSFMEGTLFKNKSLNGL